MVLFGKISIVHFYRITVGDKNIMKHVKLSSLLCTSPSPEAGNFYTFSTYIVVFTAKNDAFRRDL